MESLSVREILRSKEEQRILTGRITGIEEEYYKLQDRNIPCAIVWYEGIKILIPVTHLGVTKENKSLIRGMLNADIDFIVIEYDETSNIAIASRELAMELRAKIELPKLKKNDVVKVRIVATSTKHIIVDLYGREVVIKAENLKHTYIKVRVKDIDIEKNIFELNAKELQDNPFNNIRRYFTENSEYTGKVISFPKSRSGVIVQLDTISVTCMCRVPAKFNSYPHFGDKVLIKITEIRGEKKYIYGYLVRILWILHWLLYSDGNIIDVSFLKGKLLKGGAYMTTADLLWKLIEKFLNENSKDNKLDDQSNQTKD